MKNSIGCVLVLASILLAGSPTSGASLWGTDFDAALKQASAENKYVLVDFSGSDWCGWCIKLENEVFSKKEFISYAEENLITVLIDFPRMKELAKEQQQKNDALSRRYNVQGFPTVLILNPKGKVIEKTGYRPGGAEEYVKFLKSVIDADKAK